MRPLDRLLAELRSELRPLGWRRRRRALAEARDHLLSAVEDGVADGLSRDQAEGRAVAGFGDAAAIADALQRVRPQRRRRLVATLAAAAFAATLLVAPGPIGRELAPRTSDAAP